VHGVLVVDKPSGPTSHDVVDHVRRALRVKRAGHTGTLDPFATGVLPVCLGKATRLARFLSAGDKDYRARVRLGFATTTDDLTGEPLGAPRPVTAGLDEVAAACRALVGERLQVPPAYSAKHSAGRRLYDLARSGVDVARPAVPVVVHSLDVLQIDGDEVDIVVRCGAGTYVRALARDLGEALGVGGHLVALRRRRSGSFGEEQAVGWEDVARRGADGLVPMGALLTDLPAVTVTAEGRALLLHGRDLGLAALTGAWPAAASRVRVLDESGALVALATPRPVPAGGELPADPALHPDIVLLDV
jgi:tRNA pseudouridine55 synthase